MSAAASEAPREFGVHDYMIPGAIQKKIGKVYKFKKIIGRGAFSVVKLARHKKDDTIWAVKCILKEQLHGKVDMMRNEVDIMTAVHHPNIISLHEIYETEKKIYLVMELVEGTDLFDRIANSATFDEHSAAVIFLQLVSGVKYLHERGIIHRDLKPENLLVRQDDEHLNEIKIADFGLSKIVGEDVTLKTACGSPYYVAPEVLNDSTYDFSADTWSCGVILYTLLCGFPPFYSENYSELFELIKRGTYEFPSPYWDEISEGAKDLVSRILVVDPAERITLEAVLAHPWLLELSGVQEQLRSRRHHHKRQDSSGKIHQHHKHHLQLHNMNRAKHRFRSVILAAVEKELPDDVLLGHDDDLYDDYSQSDDEGPATVALSAPKPKAKKSKDKDKDKVKGKDKDKHKHKRKDKGKHRHH